MRTLTRTAQRAARFHLVLAGSKFLDVDSEIARGLTYLSDGKMHGLIRAREAMTWPKSKDAEIIGKMVPEVRAEATEVFEMARRWERCSAN